MANRGGAWRGERSTLDQEIAQSRKLIISTKPPGLTITPGQWCDRARYRHPIQCLGVALIESETRDARSAKHKASVAEWLACSDHSPFSLPWVADLLGLEPDYVRGRLLGKLR